MHTQLLTAAPLISIPLIDVMTTKSGIYQTCYMVNELVTAKGQIHPMKLSLDR